MTMEIKTCEQYVLAQLFDQQDENDMLNRELRRRDERIDERSLCQSYASAYRRGIEIATTGTEEEALSIVEALTDDSYQCFALLEDGTVLDLRGQFPGCVELGCEEERDGNRD